MTISYSSCFTTVLCIGSVFSAMARFEKTLQPKIEKSFHDLGRHLQCSGSLTICNYEKILDETAEIENQLKGIRNLYENKADNIIALNSGSIYFQENTFKCHLNKNDSHAERDQKYFENHLMNMKELPREMELTEWLISRDGGQKMNENDHQFGLQKMYALSQSSFTTPADYITKKNWLMHMLAYKVAPFHANGKESIRRRKFSESMRDNVKMLPETIHEAKKLLYSFSANQLCAHSNSIMKKMEPFFGREYLKVELKDNQIDLIIKDFLHIVMAADYMMKLLYDSEHIFFKPISILQSESISSDSYQKAVIDSKKWADFYSLYILKLMSLKTEYKVGEVISVFQNASKFSSWLLMTCLEISKNAARIPFQEKIENSFNVPLETNVLNTLINGEQIMEMKQKIGKIVISAERLEALRSAAEKELTEAKIQYAVKVTEMTRMEEKHAADNQQYQTKLNDLSNKIAENTTEKSELMKERETLKETVNEYKTKLEDSERRITDLSEGLKKAELDFREEKEGITAEHAEAIEKIKSDSEASIRDMEARWSISMEEIVELNKSVKDLMDLQAELENKLKVSKKNSGELEEKIIQLVSELREEKKQKKEFEVLMKEQLQQKDRLTSAINARTSEQEFKLQKQIDELMGENESLKKVLNSQGAELQNQTETVLKLQSDIERQLILIDESGAKIDNLEKENLDLAEKLEKVKNETKELKINQTDLVKELDTVTIALGVKEADLLKANDEFNHKLADSEKTMTTLHSEKENISTQLSESINEIIAIKNELEGKEKDLQVANVKIKEALEDLEKSRNDLKLEKSSIASVTTRKVSGTVSVAQSYYRENETYILVGAAAAVILFFASLLCRCGKPHVNSKDSPAPTPTGPVEVIIEQQKPEGPARIPDFESNIKKQMVRIIRSASDEADNTAIDNDLPRPWPAPPAATDRS